MPLLQPWPHVDGPQHPSAQHSCTPPPTTHTRQPPSNRRPHGPKALHRGPSRASPRGFTDDARAVLSAPKEESGRWHRVILSDRVHPHCGPTTDTTSGPRVLAGEHRACGDEPEWAQLHGPGLPRTQHGRPTSHVWSPPPAVCSQN